jgi:predicted DNA-binding transcriptional regulator AlpA
MVVFKLTELADKMKVSPVLIRKMAAGGAIRPMNTPGRKTFSEREACAFVAKFRLPAAIIQPRFPDEWLTANDVALRCKTSRFSVLRWLRDDHTMPAYRFGLHTVRFVGSEIEEWLQK